MVSYKHWFDPNEPEKTFWDKKEFYKNHNRKLNFMHCNKDIHEQFNYLEILLLKNLHLQLNSKSLHM